MFVWFFAFDFKWVCQGCTHEPEMKLITVAHPDHSREWNTTDSLTVNRIQKEKGWLFVEAGGPKCRQELQNISFKSKQT